MSCRFWKCGGFLCYIFLNGTYCCPKSGQISRFFLQSGFPQGPRGGIKVGVQQKSCSDHYSEQLSRWTPTLIPPLGPSGTPPLSLSSVIFSCDSLCLDGMMWKKASAETSGTLIHITSPSPVLLGWWWPCWRRIRWSPVGSLSGSPAE